MFLESLIVVVVGWVVRPASENLDIELILTRKVQTGQRTRAPTSAVAIPPVRSRRKELAPLLLLARMHITLCAELYNKSIYSTRNFLQPVCSAVLFLTSIITARDSHWPWAASRHVSFLPRARAALPPRCTVRRICDAVGRLFRHCFCRSRFCNILQYFTEALFFLGGGE